MNDMFQDELGQFIIVFLDDILIYSRTVDERGKHIRFVLQTLCDKQFYAKVLKIVFQEVDSWTFDD